MSKKIVVLALHLGMGGAEKVITNLSNLLVQDNEVKIISTYKLSDKPFFEINNNVNIEYLIENMTPNREELKRAIKEIKLKEIFIEICKSVKILRLRKKLMIKAIKNLDCDIVISTRILHNKWVGKYANEKIIKIAQEHNHHNNNKKYINKLIKSLKKFNYFMPVSKELADFYKGKVKNVEVKYIPNFIEKVSTQKSLLNNKQIISVGRLEAVKGFKDLIEVFGMFEKTHPDWKLHIIGDGAEKESLQEKINKEDLQNKIKLCGNKTGKQLEEEYLNSYIYLMASFSESFGLVLVEAANYGLPIIAFDSANGAKEIIENNKNGFLIPSRNKAEMVKKIEEIIENTELRERITENLKFTAEKFSREKVSQQWNIFINNL